MAPFTPPDSIVRRIWSDADTVLLVFAGSAAEFALNRAVDWLFVTEQLPQDPLGRLFSTAAYAQRIALSDDEEAERAMAQIRTAHEFVERKRGERMPDWAHRDVLYMLIDYSERAFERLHRRLNNAEREELFATFRRLGEGLQIVGLPSTYAQWQLDRERHLQQDLEFSRYTQILYDSYRRQLGWWRYALLLQVQSALAPEHVRNLLRLPRRSSVSPLLPLYGKLGRTPLRLLTQRVLIPPAHLSSVRDLDRNVSAP